MDVFNPNTYDLNDLVPKARFADIRNEEPVTNTLVPVDWNDNQFGRIPIWSGVQIDENQINAIGPTWLEEVTSGNSSAKTAVNGLKLAMSLISMKAGDFKRLLTPQTRPTEATAAQNEILADPIPAMTNFSTIPYTLRAQQVMFGPVVQEINVPAANVFAEGGNNRAADNEQQLRAAHCFLASFLMRLLTKAPQNIISSLNIMKARFESFYWPSRTIANFNITIEQATAYRDALLSHPEIMLTYTHTVANTHQYHLETLNSKEQGVLSYLCFLPFSYVGMHAYTLLVELKKFTRLDLDRLLTLFYSELTSPALIEIHTIISRYEKTASHPERSVLFRYCTPWGAQYFQRVRSRQCPHLLLVVASAWKVLNAGHPNSDPDRIVALGSISESMRATLRRAGTIAGEMLKKRVLRSQDTQIYNYALNMQDNAEQEDEVDWD